MKRLRLRLSWLLWLVVIAAAFLAGIRYGESRAAARGKRRVVRNLMLDTSEVSKWDVEVYSYPKEARDADPVIIDTGP